MCIFLCMSTVSLFQYFYIFEMHSCERVGRFVHGYMHWVNCIRFTCACEYCIVGMCLSSNLGWSYFRERPQLIGCCCADIITGAEEQQACQDLSVTHTQSTICNVPVYSTQSTNTGLILYGTMKEHMEEATKGLCAHLHIELLLVETFLSTEQKRQK